MAEVIRMTYEELRTKVSDLRNATDALGNKLYTEEDIAGFIGFSCVADLRKAMSEAMIRHRNNLIKRVAELKEAGYPDDEIAGLLKLNESTVRVLSDAEGHKRMKKVKEFEKERQEKFQKNIQKDFDEFQKNMEDTQNIMGKIFGDPFKI